MGLYHDDGIYLVTAKALAEGKGYRIISLPNEIPQTKYPILFPLALALVWEITPPFPANTLYLKVVPLAAALAWLLLVFFLMRRETGSASLAIAVALLTAASPHVLFFSTALLSETLFAVFLFGGLILLRRCEHGETNARNLLGAAAVSAAAFNTRTIGFTLVLAGVIALARSAGIRRALVYGIFCVLLTAPWIAWVVYQGHAGPDAAAYYTSESYGTWNILSDFAWEQKLRVVGWNFIYVLLIPASLMGFFFTRLWPAFALIGVLVLLGFALDARRGFNAIHIFTTLYVAVILLWVWMPLRFLVPVFPLILFFFLSGGRWIVQRFRSSRARDLAVNTVMVAVALHAGWTLGSAAHVSKQTGNVCPSANCTIQWQDVRSLLGYLSERTLPDALLMGTEDPLLYLYTGRKAIRAFGLDPYEFYYSASSPSTVEPFGPPANLGQRIADTGAEYLVIMPATDSWERHLKKQVFRFRGRHPAALKRVVGSTWGSGVYEVVSSELPKTSQLPVMRGEVLTPLKDSTTR